MKARIPSKRACERCKPSLSESDLGPGTACPCRRVVLISISGCSRKATPSLSCWPTQTRNQEEFSSRSSRLNLQSPIGRGLGEAGFPLLLRAALLCGFYRPLLRASPTRCTHSPAIPRGKLGLIPQLTLHAVLYDGEPVTKISCLHMRSRRIHSKFDYNVVVKGNTEKKREDVLRLGKKLDEPVSRTGDWTGRRSRWRL